MDRKTTKERSVRPQPGAAHLEATPHPNTDAIARRAYALYEARGRTPGHEEEDWLAAERELMEEREAPVATAPARRTKRERPRAAEI
jgi:Protein of unknown function (DUF2934)